MELSEQKDDVINKLQSAMEDQRNVNSLIT